MKELMPDAATYILRISKLQLLCGEFEMSRMPATGVVMRVLVLG